MSCCWESGFTLAFTLDSHLNPNLSGLLRRLFLNGWGVNSPIPCLKLVKIMLETSKLVCKYTHICSFIKYIFQYQDSLNFRDVSIFLQKISTFWQKYFSYSKQQCESCLKIFLVSFSVFLRQKVAFNENVSFTDYASKIWLSGFSKLAINWKNDNDVTICRNDVKVNFFHVFLSLLSSLVTGPSFMSISSLVLELWQFTFIRDWSEIGISELHSSEFWKHLQTGLS